MFSHMGVLLYSNVLKYNVLWKSFKDNTLFLIVEIFSLSWLQGDDE